MINFDESVVNTTDKRSRGWFIKSKRNIVTHTQRLASMNIIAAVSNKGRFIYTVNKGKNNGDTMIHFLLKLCELLNKESPDWRAKTVLLTDNAPYHRSKAMMDKYRQLKLPMMFFGPYQFKLAPIELMYSYIKNRDLNPLKTRAQAR